MNLKLYGLFQMSYDYHTWETLNYVSADVDRLLAYAEGDDDELPITTDGEASKLLGRKETRHWYIKEVDSL
jgi:hypothetical protein